MKIIGHLYSDFTTKFGIPRQSGIVKEIKGKIILEKEYRVAEAFRELEGFSHIWLIWQFSEAVREDWRPTVRPPMLGGNTRVGVFATRSPYRPNSMGLSAVKLDKIEYTDDLGPVLHVSGADLMNGTPIYDIKPYLPFADSIPDATDGFAGKAVREKLTVDFPEALSEIIPDEKLDALIAVLADDPRPTYIDDTERIYGISFGGYEIKFRVADGTLSVIKTEKI
ncbi:MAG: tRNA (N6-threonylcarbamoyladenosine(37)-N6)-methyltransferase TrmO [Clostridia bacterium]|nr:tRNA (N6-threonylcarbamoyladenosine(37)-N6)-methyltransferase TrmO [Clostridia bacterium]